MPEIPIESSERKQVDGIVEFVRSFMSDLSASGRLVLTVQLLRLLDPEIKELRRKTKISQ